MYIEMDIFEVILTTVDTNLRVYVRGKKFRACLCRVNLPAYRNTESCGWLVGECRVLVLVLVFVAEG